MEDVSKGKRL